VTCAASVGACDVAGPWLARCLGGTARPRAPCVGRRWPTSHSPRPRHGRGRERRATARGRRLRDVSCRAAAGGPTRQSGPPPWSHSSTAVSAAREPQSRVSLAARAPTPDGHRHDHDHDWRAADGPTLRQTQPWSESHGQRATATLQPPPWPRPGGCCWKARAGKPQSEPEPRPKRQVTKKRQSTESAAAAATELEGHRHDHRHDHRRSWSHGHGHGTAAPSRGHAG